MRAPVTQQFPRFPPVNLKNFNLDMRKRFQENEATFEKGLKDVEACFGITGVTFQADYDELYQQASERCKVLVPCIAQYPSAWVTNLKAWGTLDKPANKRCMMLTWTTKRMGFRLTESTHRDDRFYTEFKDGVMWFVSSKDYILNGFDVIGGRAPRGTMTDNDMSLDVLLDYDANVPKMKQHIAELEEAIGVTGLSFVVEDWKAYEAAYVVKMVQTPNCVWSSLYDGYLADLTRWLKGHCQRDPMNKEAIRDALSGKKIIFRVRKGAEFNKRKIKNMSASYHVEYFEDGNLVIEANADEAASVGSIGEYILSQL